MLIYQNLTTRNLVRRNDTARIKYIVIHYTANDKDTAKNNTDYIKTEYRGVSAHYYVDTHEIWQGVEDKNIAWHCGGEVSYVHPYCRNSNSIGIELCSRYNGNLARDKKNNCIDFGKFYFEDATVTNAIKLTKQLMKQYNIPVENVIRHYDVTGKICPAPFCEERNYAWSNFKQQLMMLDEINDIAWELGNRQIAKDLPYWIKRMTDDQNIYWLCYKIVNHILFKCGSPHEATLIQSQNDVLWDLKYWGIISNTALWKTKFLLESNNTFILAKNAANYIRTHSK